MIIEPSNPNVSQRRKILSLLRNQHTATSIELNRICYRYSARIHELRKAGHKITSRQIKRGVWEYTYVE